MLHIKQPDKQKLTMKVQHIILSKTLKNIHCKSVSKLNEWLQYYFIKFDETGLEITQHTLLQATMDI